MTTINSEHTKDSTTTGTHMSNTEEMEMHNQNNRAGLDQQDNDTMDVKASKEVAMEKAQENSSPAEGQQYEGGRTEDAAEVASAPG